MTATAARGLVGAALICVGSGLLACAPEDAEAPWQCSRELRKLIPVHQPPRYDALIVVDRSPSMADDAARLAEVGTALGATLQQLGGGGWMDLRLAVVSSDLGAAGVPGCDPDGDGGRFQAAARCGLDGSFVRWRIGVDGGREQNFAADIGAELACLLALGPSTCTVSQPLAALVRALDGSNPANDGFRRAGVPLLVGVITDGDDCSLVAADALTASGWPLTDEAAVDFACFAEGVACAPDDPARPGPHAGCAPRPGAGFADPARTVAVLAGDERLWWSSTDAGPAVVVDAGETLAPACPGGTSATAAPRLAALGGARSSVCGPFWADGLLRIAETFPIGIGDPCAPLELDVAPAVPGLQVRCDGRLVWRGRDGVVDQSQPLPWCGDADGGPGQPCLRLDPDAADACPEGGSAIRFDPGADWPRAGALIDLRCEVPCAPPDSPGGEGDQS